MLNDLFGIQSRGGCSCAGPYGHRLLGIDIERSHEFEREITGGCEGIKPGWVRVNFNYFISDTVADYVVEAVRMVARDGWRLLGDYVFEPGARAVAAPRGRRRAGHPPRRRALRATTGRCGCRAPTPRRGEEVLAEQLREGARILAAATPPAAGHDEHVSVDFEHLRWFDLPEGSIVTTSRPVGPR